MVRICWLFAVSLWVTLWAVTATASPSTLSYQGRILKSDGTVLNYGSVSFIFKIYNPSATCLIYQEQINGYDMTTSNGLFDVAIGSGTVSYPTNGSLTLLDVFNNSTSFTCSGGSTFTPMSGSTRVLRVMFHDGSGWQTISPDSVIRSMPYAGYAASAERLGTNLPSDFLLKAGLPTCTSGTYLSYDGTSLTCAAVSGSNGGTVTSIVAGTGLSGGTITSSGTIALSTSGVTAATYGSATQVPVFAVDSYGRVTSVTNTAIALSASDLPTVPASKGGTGLTATPANGQLLIGNGSGYTLGTLTAGSNITITNSAGGITIAAAGSGSGTVTSVTGTSPISVTNTTTTPAITISQANSTTNGYLSSTDWSTFNSKQSSTLADGKIFVGNSSNVATAVSVSGDATLLNAGALTLAASGTSAGSYAKVTVNTKGLVTAGSSLAVSDIPSISSLIDTISSTQGSILYRGSAGWSVLAPGTSGQYLQTQGTSANPQWATLSTTSVGSGGTGLTSGTSGGIPYFSSTSTMASSALLTQYGVVYGGGAGAAPATTAVGTSGYPLVSNGGSSAPSFQQISLSSAITGTLPVANGGTGATTASAARSSLSAAQSGANTDITSITNSLGSVSIAPTGALALSPTTYVTSTAPFAGPLGSAAAPTFTNTTNTATGLYFPTSTSVGISTSGTSRMVLDPTSSTGVMQVYGPNVTGMTTGLLLKTGSTAATTDVTDATGIGVDFQMIDDNTTSPTNPQGRIAVKVGSDHATAHGESSGQMVFYTSLGDVTNDTFNTNTLNERMRINEYGDVGIGTASPGIDSDYLGRTYLTIKGSGTGAATGPGVLQLTSNATDASGNNLGNIEWHDSANTSSNHRAGFISMATSTTTANNRGSDMTFGTRPDAGSSVIERVRITSAGLVGIGNTSPTSPLSVLTNTVSLASRFENSPTLTANASGNYHGSWSSVTPASSYNFTGSLYAAVNRVQTNASQTGTISTAFGAISDVYHYGGSSISNAYGNTGQIMNLSTGSISDARAGYFLVSNSSTGTITNAYGNYIAPPTNSGGGTIGTFYGLYIGNPVNANTNFALYAAGGKSYFGGNVGIGTSSPSYTLHVVGNAGLSTGTAWTNASDARLKDIHGDYEYGLDEVLRLHTVRYSYKENNPLGLPSDFNKTGFIAQEVQKVIPDAVSKRKDGYLELNVDPIHWAVVNAVKELYQKWFDDSEKTHLQLEDHNARIKALEDKLALLAEQNEELRAQNETLKKSRAPASK